MQIENIFSKDELESFEKKFLQMESAIESTANVRNRFLKFIEDNLKPCEEKHFLQLYTISKQNTIFICYSKEHLVTTTNNRPCYFVNSIKEFDLIISCLMNEYSEEETEQLLKIII